MEEVCQNVMCSSNMLFCHINPEMAWVLWVAFVRLSGAMEVIPIGFGEPGKAES